MAESMQPVSGINIGEVQTPMQQLVAQSAQQPVQPVQQPAQQPVQPVQQPVQQQTMVQPAQQVQQPVQAPIPFQTIINQKDEQINALIAQTNSLNAQIAQLIQGGAQIPTEQPVQPVQQQAPMQAQLNQAVQAEFPNVYEPYNQTSLASNQDFSLESLAGEIGKKN